LRGAIGWTDRWRVVGGLWRVREEVRGLEIAGHGKDPFGLVWAHGEGQLLRLLEVVDLSCQILRLRVSDTEQELHAARDSVAIADTKTGLDQMQLKARNVVGGRRVGGTWPN
jgi:hypothetical protein